MKYLAITILAVFLSSCILTKSAGGFDVSGKVVNEVTNEPIEGAEVYLNYSAISFWGDHSKKLGHTTTDETGVFFIPAEEVRLWGGVGGGLDGAISEWPTVYVEKEGYSSTGSSNINPGPEKYRNMLIKMSPRGVK